MYSIMPFQGQRVHERLVVLLLRRATGSSLLNPKPETLNPKPEIYKPTYTYTYAYTYTYTYMCCLR